MNRQHRNLFVKFLHEVGIFYLRPCIKFHQAILQVAVFNRYSSTFLRRRIRCRQWIHTCVFSIFAPVWRWSFELEPSTFLAEVAKTNRTLVMVLLCIEKGWLGKLDTFHVFPTQNCAFCLCPTGYILPKTRIAGSLFCEASCHIWIVSVS